MSDSTSDAERGLARGVIAASATNPVAARLLTVFLLAGGLFAASQLEIALWPEVDLRQVEIVVPYPGASPGEIERDINLRLEERLLQLDGIRGVTSEAQEGMALVSVELGLFVSKLELLEDIRIAVERLEGFPPDLAETPRIGLAKDAPPVLSVAVRSSSLSDDELRLATDRVREDLLSLAPVSLVRVVGVPAREIAIEVDEETLREYGLTTGDLATAVARATGGLTFGELQTESGLVVLRSQMTRTRGTDYADIVLKTDPGGGVVTVADVAQVIDGFEDSPRRTDIDGVPAVILSVLLGTDGDSLAILSAVRDWLRQYEPPHGVEVMISDDRDAANAEASITGLLTNVILGFVLVLVLLGLVFDLRVATWIAIGVPCSFLGACLLFPAFDVTLAPYAILALFIVVGIVVDDAVVVGESIADQHDQGRTGIAAAIAGARRVLGPVGIGVVTTMLAFAPLFFTHGPIGQWFKDVPVVVTLVLAFSLVEAFLILPAHLGHGGRWSAPPLTGVQVWANSRLNEIRDRFVVPIVAASLRRPFVTISAALAVLVVAAIAVLTGTLRFTFMDIPERGTVYLNITFPHGTPLEVTSNAAEQAVAAARRANDQLGGDAVDTITTDIGTNNLVVSNRNLAPADGTHLAMVVVRLRRDVPDPVQSPEFKDLWQSALGSVGGAERVEIIAGGRFSTVEYAFTHPDENMVARAVDAVRAELEAMPGVSGVFDSHRLGKRQLDIELTPLGLAAGLAPSDLAMQLRARFFGLEVQRIQRDGHEIKVVVRYPESRRRDLSELRNELMLLPDGNRAPFSEVARVTESRGHISLLRVDGNRAGTIGAFVDVVTVTASEVNAAVLPVIEELLEAEPDLDLVTLGTPKAIADLFESVSLTYPLAIAAMYMLIAMLLRSYVLPLVTLVAIPVAAAGAVFGHLLLGYDLTMASIFGIVAVSGIVINDTLVLLDRYNTIRAERDIAAVAAIAAAARQRFRAIALTTATTVVGLAPLLYVDTGLSVMVYVPLVISIIFGLIAASVGVLLLLPAVLLLEENARERLERA